MTHYVPRALAFFLNLRYDYGRTFFSPYSRKGVITVRNLRTFEDSLFPHELRWVYALSNAAADAKLVHDGKKEEFSVVAPRLYPGFENVNAVSRMGVMNLMIPVGCNATCPDICYTDIVNWKRDPGHITFPELLGILEEFQAMGGKWIRIVGDGEPVLYKQLGQLCQWTRECGINLLVFSNGVSISKSILREYERGNLYFYIKLWSENAEVQNKMIAPRTPYHYIDGKLGPAPRAFYELYDINAERVGFEILVSSINLEDARQIVNGPKVEVPLFVEPFIAEGSGKGHYEFIAKSPVVTKQCEQPPRASYLGVINSRGELQPGTLVPEGAVSVKGSKLKETWNSIFTSSELFFKARYSAGCFCETMRNY